MRQVSEPFGWTKLFEQQKKNKKKKTLICFLLSLIRENQLS